MSYFIPLIANPLLTAAAMVQLHCVMPQPAQISATPSTQAIDWDYSKTTEEIQGTKMDTVNPYSFSGQSFTEGYMRGSIKLTPKVDIKTQTWPNLGLACAWYNSISIDMDISPAIVIPREVHEDACMNQAVSDHEMKHINVDRRLVNEYSQVMAQKVFDGLTERGFYAGPVPLDQLNATVQRMQDTVNQIVAQEYKRMDLDRTDAQRGVDSIEEYRRVQALCPEYSPLFLQQERRR